MYVSFTCFSLSSLNISCQPHIMSLLKELDLEVYDQFTEGKKVAQLAGDRVSTYKSEIPSLPLFALLDLHFFMKRVINVACNTVCVCMKQFLSISPRQVLYLPLQISQTLVLKSAGLTNQISEFARCRTHCL